jgi:hypothetical protein
MPRTLADRLQSHAQQKARLAEREMLPKEAERKARTRRLIEAGGLVEKAGLLALDANALYGLLLSAKGSVDDPDTLAHWTALGGRAFPVRPAPRTRPGKPSSSAFQHPLLAA